MMNIRKLVLILILSIQPYQLFGGGTDLTSVTSSKSLSLNGIYTAGVDGVGVLINNPANLSLLYGTGVELMISDKIGTQYFANEINGEYESFKNDDIIIGAGLYWNIGENLTLAIGYNPILNYSVEWAYSAIKEKGDNSLIMAFDYFNKISVNSISTGLGYKFGLISVGVTANIYQAKQQIAYPINNDFWYADSGRAAYQVNYDLDGFDYGFTFGMGFDLTPSFSLGVNMRSGVSIDLSGTANSEYFVDIHNISSQVNMSTTFEIPWIISTGILLKLTEDIALNLDGRINLWSNVKNNFDYTFDNETWHEELSKIDSSTGLSGTSFTTDFRNSIELGIGFEWVDDKISYRASYRYTQSPMDDQMYSMLLCSVDQHWIAGGISLVEENWIIDLTVAYAFGIEKQINSNPIPVLNGKYNSDTFLPSITMRYVL